MKLKRKRSVPVYVGYDWVVCQSCVKLSDWTLMECVCLLKGFCCRCFFELPENLFVTWANKINDTIMGFDSVEQFL